MLQDFYKKAGLDTLEKVNGKVYRIQCTTPFSSDKQMRVISILSKKGLLIEQDEGIYYISFHKVEEKFKYHINGFVSLPVALEALLVKIWDDINEFERAEIRRVFIGLGVS